MLLRETGFTFGGAHSRRDMGLIYAEKEGHIAIPEIKRNSYQIAGMSGTVLMDGEAWQPFNFEGTLYPAEEPRTQAEAQALLRDVSTWLAAGRRQLIFDYEPAVYYEAELSAQSKWSLRNWFGGELQIRFTAQPFARSLVASTGTAELNGSGTVSVTVETGLPAPLELTVQNIGSGNITGVSVGSAIALAGMTLGQGQRLIISSETPIGAEIGNASAMRYATKFAPVYLDHGVNQVSVGLTFSGSGRARVTASARGRW